MKKSQFVRQAQYKQGFTPIVLILIVIGIIVVIGGIYYISQRNASTSSNNETNASSTLTQSQTTNTTSSSKTSTPGTKTTTTPKPTVTSKPPVVSGTASVSTAQSVINGYSTCRTSDINCVANYLDDVYFTFVRSYGVAQLYVSFPAFSQIRNSTIVKHVATLPQVVNGRSITVERYLTKNSTSQCLNVDLYKVGGLWKIGLPNSTSCDN